MFCHDQTLRGSTTMSGFSIYLKKSTFIETHPYVWIYMRGKSEPRTPAYIEPTIGWDISSRKKDSWLVVFNGFYLTTIELKNGKTISHV